MEPIIFATGNKHKFDEIRAMLPEKLQIKSFADINFNEDIPETENTLEGNALLKARFIHDRYNMPCFADDSGLEVEALDGAPGVISSHYAGIDGTAEVRAKANIDKLLEELDGKTNKKARFRTVIAYIDQQKKEHIFEGIVDGYIIETPVGKEGFGYDPVFVPQGYDKSFAQMSMDEKNMLSHRALAFKKFVHFIKK